MPMSGLLLRLAVDADVPNLLAELESHPAIETGDVIGRSLPIAVEASGPKDAREKHDWIESLPDVDRAEVVHVSFNDHA